MLQPKLFHFTSISDQRTWGTRPTNPALEIRTLGGFGEARDSVRESSGRRIEREIENTRRTEYPRS